MTHPLPIILLTLATTFPLMARQPLQDTLVSVGLSGNAIDVRFEGSRRLAGGVPRFQSGTPVFRGVTERGGVYSFQGADERVDVAVKAVPAGHVVTIFVTIPLALPLRADEYAGLFFEGMPGFTSGVSLWRYGPWKCWSKPVRVQAPGELNTDDVQFFYWRYRDGVYGAAMPLSGNGYRSTLGQDGGRFGSKAVSGFDARGRGEIPLLAIGFGRDPYALFEELWSAGMTAMGHPENLRTQKTFPAVFENIGWCTWNSSSLGKNLNEDLLLRAAQYFRDVHFPIRWFLVDDGWFEQTGSKLNSFRPDARKFPHGFRDVIRRLKEEFHLEDVGVWHALNGYWQGINPESELGKEYGGDLIVYREPVHPDRDTASWRTCTFVSPLSGAPARFYDEFHRTLSDEGFTFVKVDNQLVVERMAAGNFPIWDGAVAYHGALNASVARHFNNAIINCMDMTPDAWGNFSSTAVARTSEDYFPYEKGETYNLQKGNAAAHVLQAVYNALYFSQMVFPDFDHFQSHNPNAVFHAIARAINNGPIYITDNIGEGNIDILRPLVYADGRIIRSDEPLLPAEDCLFQVQDPIPFKAFSRAGDTGLIGIWNCADADRVEGSFRASDVHSIQGDSFALYERMSGAFRYARRDEVIPVSLGRLGCLLYYVIPLNDGMGAIGLVEKYNAPATLLQCEVRPGVISAVVREGGSFAAVGPRAPASVTADGTPLPFTYTGGLVVTLIPRGGETARRHVEIRF
jgi:raffinose synthase